MKVYKYKLDVTDKQVVELPYSAEILTVQTQQGDPYMWALIDETEDFKKGIIIETFGTGNPIEDGRERKYISTYQMAQGNLVFHVFQRI